MDRTQLKQRIVGAIVLVALGVIFIPVILHKQEESTVITGTNIPPKPETLQQLARQPVPDAPPAPDIDTSRPKPVDELTPQVEQLDTSPSTKTEQQPKLATTEQNQTTSSKAEAKTQTKSTTSGKATPERAWVVQVASFSERTKALKLRDKLRAKKYPTFVESVQSKSGIRYRVRVGPEVQKAKAEELKKQIARTFKIRDALVMSHP